MIHSIYNYTNVFQGMQLGSTPQTNNKAVSSMTVPMVQSAPVCPACKGDCGDYTDVVRGYPKQKVIDERCLKPVPESLVDSKNPHADKDIKLKPEVLAAFMKMHEEALKDKKFNKNGTNILLDTGFRNKLKQAAVAAHSPKLAAPVGYTEHHTGCTIDVSLRGLGENSDVYKWMKEHAAEYGFELSYPHNNKQKVMPESWHWRFNEDLLKQKV